MDEDFLFRKGNGKSKILLVFFGGMGTSNDPTLINKKLPFEFIKLTDEHFNQNDRLFFADHHQCWYHKGYLKNKIVDIDDTAKLINDVINKCSTDNKKIIFIGISSGGYAAILFGSILHVNTVLAIKPQTNLNYLEVDGMVGGKSSFRIKKINLNQKYLNLSLVLNNKTKYICYGDLSVRQNTNCHHVLQCRNINKFKNVKVRELNKLDIKLMSTNGELLKILNIYIVD